MGRGRGGGGRAGRMTGGAATAGGGGGATLDAWLNDPRFSGSALRGAFNPARLRTMSVSDLELERAYMRRDLRTATEFRRTTSNYTNVRFSDQNMRSAGYESRFTPGEVTAAQNRMWTLRQGIRVTSAEMAQRGYPNGVVASIRRAGG